MHLTGFEPVMFHRKPDYESGAFDHSATNAIFKNFFNFLNSIKKIFKVFLSFNHCKQNVLF